MGCVCTAMALWHGIFSSGTWHLIPGPENQIVSIGVSVSEYRIHQRPLCFLHTFIDGIRVLFVCLSCLSAARHRKCWMALKTIEYHTLFGSLLSMWWFLEGSLRGVPKTWCSSNFKSLFLGGCLVKMTHLVPWVLSFTCIVQRARPQHIRQVLSRRRPRQSLCALAATNCITKASR